MHLERDMHLAREWTVPACLSPDPSVSYTPSAVMPMVSKPHRRHGCCHTKLPGRASVMLDLGPRRPDLAAGSPNGRASKEKGVGCGKPDSYRCRLGRGARRKVGEVLWLEDEGRRGRPAARRLAMASRFALVGLGLNKLGLVGKEKISVLRSARRRCCRPLTVNCCACAGHHSCLRAAVGLQRRYA